MKTTMKLLAATALVGTGAIAGATLNHGGLGAFAAGGYGMERGHWGKGHHHGYRKGKRGRGGMRRMLRRLKAMDADGNDEVTRDEFVAHFEQRFAALDANNDTVLDGDELIARRTARKEWRAKRRMRRLDTDNNGRITKEELQAQARKRFSYRDLNDDGVLNRDDMPPRGKRRGRDGADNDGGEDAANAEGETEAREYRGKGRRGYGRRRGPRTLEQALERAERRFNRLDANGDGAIELAELGRRGQGRREYYKKRRLKRLDTNNDGTVSKEEFVNVRTERFRIWDLDDDGAITAKDLPPGMAKRWEKK